MSAQTEAHVQAQCFFSNSAMEQDKNIPDNMKSNIGKVAVIKSSGRFKVRKGQNEEAYKEQRDMFWKSGPLVQDEDTLVNFLEDTLEEGYDCNILLMTKIDREKIIHSLERLYFLGDYRKCLNDLENVRIGSKDIDLNLKRNKGLKNLIQNFDKLRKACESKIGGQNNDVK